MKIGLNDNGLCPLFTFVIDVIVKIVSYLSKQSITADKGSTNKKRNYLGNTFMNQIGQFVLSEISGYFCFS